MSHLAFLNSCFIKYMLFCIHKITCAEEVSVGMTCINTIITPWVKHQKGAGWIWA